MTDAERTTGHAANDYFPRRLRSADTAAGVDFIDEGGLLGRSGARVVLAEPGMGKSELLVEVGRRLGTEPVSAMRFSLSGNPLRFVRPGLPLLIDGLDEAMARREGDAVTAVLSKLDDAGAPPFILTCRSREWQSRGETGLRQLYGADPAVFSLEPFGRGEAGIFLASRNPGADGDHVLDHLDRHGLTELYRNPLTLGLIGRVAETDRQLPDTRAALFTRVCALIWPEHDRDRQDIGLAQLTEDEALDAAGAIAAALLFGGAEAVSIAGAALHQEGDLQLSALTALPGAAAARAMFSSNLFVGMGATRAKPIHRVVAEFLGARWLAGRASSPRTQRRLLAQFHGGGAVPASLRGLHAWLAYHSPAMAERVIAADPFGLLRYGETGDLSPAQADALFDALSRLAEEDPYFRASDWDAATATGLMIAPLAARIEAAIGSPASNSHLRSLLIEAVRGTELVQALGPTLEAVMFDEERFYREREDAADALLQDRGAEWWRSAVERLRREGTEDAARLARTVIERVDAAVPDELLVATLFAELGLTITRLPKERKRRGHTLRSHSRVVAMIETERLPSVLDLLADYATLVPRYDWQSYTDIADISANLTLRAIDEGAIGAADAGRLWQWLGTVEHARQSRRASKRDLAAALVERRDLRQAVQRHVLDTARRQDSVWQTELDLQRRLVGLSMHVGDAAALLAELEGADNRDARSREDWQDLVRLAHRRDGFEPGARDSALRFARTDPQLLAFLRKTEDPRPPAWQVRQEREQAKRDRKRRVEVEEDRREFAAHRAELVSGTLCWIVGPAQSYLGIRGRGSRELPPRERLVDLLGDGLAADALTGLEAALHRADLPTVAQVTTGFAEDVTYNYCFAIMAGLLERQRAGVGFGGVSAEVLLTGLLLCHHDRGWCSDDDLAELRSALEALLLPNLEARVAFAQVWIEPSLTAGREHVNGLYMLSHGEGWQPTGGALADGWLTRFPDVPQSVEVALIECLTHAGELGKLRAVAEARSGRVFRNEDHLLTWLAVDVLVRFEEVRADIAGIGVRHPEFVWFLRNRIQLERRGAMLPTSVAQAAWIWSEFRAAWPSATLEGSGSGNTNDYDATDFLGVLLSRLADDGTEEAAAALQALIAGPEDSYSELIRHMAAEQRQKRAEESFAPVSAGRLGQLLDDGPPGNIDDLKTLVLEELEVAQAKLRGEDVDQVRDFWSDAGIPYGENRCRDRLAAIIGPELMRYGIQRITEADMPMTKRVDLAFARGPLQLPLEVKGQWHADVWDAATGQLDLQYLIDWRCEQRGVYCVLWFGDLPSATNRRLKAHPDGMTAPADADAMRALLVERIPVSRRPLIEVVVLDLTAGTPT